MIVINQATVLRVYPFEEKNRDTGVITHMHKVDMVHTTSDQASSEMELVTLKLKEQVQADAFGRALGKAVSVPVRVWTAGNSSGFWLEKGVLPTVAAQQPQPAKAAA